MSKNKTKPFFNKKTLPNGRQYYAKKVFVTINLNEKNDEDYGVSQAEQAVLCGADGIFLVHFWFHH